MRPTNAAETGLRVRLGRRQSHCTNDENWWHHACSCFIEHIGIPLQSPAAVRSQPSTRLSAKIDSQPEPPNPPVTFRRRVNKHHLADRYGVKLTSESNRSQPVIWAMELLGLGPGN